MFFVLFTLQVSPNLKTCYCPRSVPRSTLRPISRQETAEVGPGGDDPCQGMLKILINCPISCLPKKSVKWWVRPASKQAHMQHLTIIALVGALCEISLTAVLSQAQVDHHHHQVEVEQGQVEEDERVGTGTRNSYQEQQIRGVQTKR